MVSVTGSNPAPALRTEGPPGAGGGGPPRPHPPARSHHPAPARPGRPTAACDDAEEDGPDDEDDSDDAEGAPTRSRSVRYLEGPSHLLRLRRIDLAPREPDPELSRGA